MDEAIPLCLDLDGTLILSDTLVESAVELVKRNPFLALRMPLWLLSGKAHLKARISEHTTLDAGWLPYRTPLVEWARQQAVTRRVFLVSAAHRDVAHGVAKHLGFVHEVLATDEVNLKAERKAELLVQRFGHGRFDYVGNGMADLPVWRVAREAMVVGASPSLMRKVQEIANVTRVFDPAPPAGVALRSWVRALRLYQWVKNLLLFLAPAAAHLLLDIPTLTRSVAAFVAFCLASSGVYLLNDLLDLTSDRRHPRKRYRPLASGTLPLAPGFVMAPVLIASSLALALWINLNFTAVVLMYLVTTTAYSLWLKRKMFLDVAILAGLYSLRVIAGAAAVGIGVSFWLLALCAYGFLGLALLKRCAELSVNEEQGNVDAGGRAYRARDLPVVLALGVGASLVATLVMALYIDSPTSRALYTRPELLWLLVGLMTLGVGRLWLKAGRGDMRDDPIIFIAKDPWCLLLLALAAAVALAAI